MSNTEIKEHPGRLDLIVDSNLFTSYCFAPDQARPWFYPVNSPSGRALTCNGTADAPHHHSLWFGMALANGCDFWHDASGGRIVSASGPATTGAETEMKIVHNCSWVAHDGRPILQDRRTFQFHLGEEDGGYVLDMEFSLCPVSGEVSIPRVEHALLAVQMAPAFSAVNGGLIHNSMSDEGEEETCGKEAFWCDCSGEVDGAECGLTVFSHPDNPVHPPAWVTRDSGYFSPNFFTTMEKETWPLSPGQETCFRYRVLCHEGDVYDGNAAVYWGEYAAGY